MTEVLAENVRVRRAAARLQQADLAKRMIALGLEWTRSTVSAVERGSRNVTVDELLSLALALGTDPAGLLDPRGITGRAQIRVDLGRVVLRGELVGAWLEHRGFIGAEWSAEGEPSIEAFTFGWGEESDSELERIEVEPES